MGVHIHIRIEAQRTGEKWCLRFDAPDIHVCSRSTKARLVGSYHPRRITDEDSLGFGLGDAPLDSPYYSLSGDEYTPFIWAPWALVVSRLDKLEPEDGFVGDWVGKVEAWRLSEGLEREQLRAVGPVL